MMSTASDDTIPSSSTRFLTLVSPASTPRRTRRRAALAAFLMLAIVAPAAAASAQTLPPQTLPVGPALVPANIHASPALLHLLSRMARRSATFRAQCARISGTPGLVVRMRFAGLRDDRPFYARTTVRRHEYGAVIAEVDLYAPIDAVEIVAHEFEHLVEQIQGTDLRTLARVRGSGVTEVRRGEFETQRAVEAGRRVAAEWSETDRVAVAAPEDETGE
jgi:hypothetical protein